MFFWASQRSCKCRGDYFRGDLHGDGGEGGSRERQDGGRALKPPIACFLRRLGGVKERWVLELEFLSYDTQQLAVLFSFFMPFAFAPVWFASWWRKRAGISNACAVTFYLLRAVEPFFSSFKTSVLRYYRTLQPFLVKPDPSVSWDGLVLSGSVS